MTPCWGRGSAFEAGTHCGATGRISAVSPAERCARLSCVSGPTRTQGCRTGVETRRLPATFSPAYACPTLRPHRCLATAPREQRLPVPEGGGGEETPPDPFPLPFLPPAPLLRQWLPREGAGRAWVGARTLIRYFTAVLCSDTIRSIPRGGAGARRQPGCQRWGGLFLLPQHPGHPNASARSRCFGRPSQYQPLLASPRRQAQFKTRLK